jgi:hypothetical protein
MARQFAEFFGFGAIVFRRGFCADVRRVCVCVCLVSNNFSLSLSVHTHTHTQMEKALGDSCMLLDATGVVDTEDLDDPYTFYNPFTFADGQVGGD